MLLSCNWTPNLLLLSRSFYWLLLRRLVVDNQLTHPRAALAILYGALLLHLVRRRCVKFFVLFFLDFFFLLMLFGNYLGLFHFDIFDWLSVRWHLTSPLSITLLHSGSVRNVHFFLLLLHPWCNLI